jgi:hypothetical protein
MRFRTVLGFLASSVLGVAYAADSAFVMLSVTDLRSGDVFELAVPNNGRDQPIAIEREAEGPAGVHEFLATALPAESAVRIHSRHGEPTVLAFGAGRTPIPGADLAMSARAVSAVELQRLQIEATRKVLDTARSLPAEDVKIVR